MAGLYDKGDKFDFEGDSCSRGVIAADTIAATTRRRINEARTHHVILQITWKTYR